MTTETSNARGEVVAWEARDPADGTRWVTRHARERDGWAGLGRTIRPLIYGDAPPPAAARGDVRGLVALAERVQYADTHAQVSKDDAGEFVCLPPWLWLEIRDAAVEALAAEGVQAVASENVRRLVGKLDQWRHCMSHNESYFGEPAGLVKSVSEGLARAVDPIYPPKLEPVDTLAGVTIRTASVPFAEGVQAGDVERIRAAQDAAIAKVGAEMQAEQRARELLAQQYDECDPDYAQTVRDGEDLDQDDTIALRAIASALSQQPEPKAEARGVVDEAVPRYVCLKAEGSRYAYVNDTQESRTVKRYDIFRRYGGVDGWTCATEHAASLNALTGERNG